ncbi:hypothetical protein EXIGUO8A_440006 [Exiguobacterium sp. 8A]|uniref:hypothetical protein n=1 Tax=Exiguobacterium sp. 8A TaxID=2653139 RepID=UPI0012EFBD7B|nr:hypothetical protein [Exiguobacterium sp. 8A]VXB98248.1 hypothetical protein EXIGUO8A_440006 [Exiguobacterium sp. 8A]
MREKHQIILRGVIIAGLVGMTLFTLYRIGDTDTSGAGMDVPPPETNEREEKEDLVAKQNAVIAQLRDEIATLKAGEDDATKTPGEDADPTPEPSGTDAERIADTVAFATDYWTYDGPDDLLKPSVLDRLTDGFRERLETEPAPPSPSFEAEVKHVEAYLRHDDETHVTAFVEVNQTVDIAGKKSEDNVLARVHWTSTPDGWRVDDVTVPTVGVTIPDAPEGGGEG